MYATALWLYFVLLVGIIVVPGMDMFFVLANALTGGRPAGLAATAGIMLGGVCHTLFGTMFVVGLSSLVPAISKVMLLAGSLYMLWIGISLLRSTIEVHSVAKAAHRSTPAIFLQGLLTCILNPKAWLFVLAVFPQFMKPEYGPIGVQAFVMGLMTVFVQMTVYGGLALAAGKGREALTGHPAATVLIGRAAGALLVATAAFALWEALSRT